MASLRFYGLVYVLLLALVTVKVLFFEFFGYWIAITGTLVSAVLEAGLIAGYYQHLAEEPRSLTYLMVLSVFLVLLLMAAASYSIT